MAETYSFSRIGSGPDKRWVLRWQVRKNASDTTYIVAMQGDGQWGCSCPAWKFGRNVPNSNAHQRVDCKHINLIKANEPSSYMNNALTELSAKVFGSPSSIASQMASGALGPTPPTGGSGVPPMPNKNNVVSVCQMCNRTMRGIVNQFDGNPICADCLMVKMNERAQQSLQQSLQQKIKAMETKIKAEEFRQSMQPSQSTDSTLMKSKKRVVTIRKEES